VTVKPSNSIRTEGFRYRSLTRAAQFFVGQGFGPVLMGLAAHELQRNKVALREILAAARRGVREVASSATRTTALRDGPVSDGAARIETGWSGTRSRNTRTGLGCCDGQASAASSELCLSPVSKAESLSSRRSQSCPNRENPF
jgi:hypothetical protein